MHFIITNVIRRDRVMQLLAKASGGKVKSTWDGHTPPCIVGNDVGMDDIQKECNKKKIPYLYVDHAYFNRHSQMERFRLCVSNYHCTDWRDSDRQCTEKVRPWRTGGSNIVIIHPAPKVGTIYPVKQWLDETVERLKTLTDRKVIIKMKGEGALNDCLIDAFAAVCYGSVADVDAVRLGVPVFAGEHSPVWPIAEHDLSRIETPSTPDRAQWLRSLAASEWSLDESNLAWERVRCLLPHTQTCKPQ